MKATIQDGYGVPEDVLELKDIDRPVPGDDDVLIRVRAAGINPADWAGLRGEPYLARLGFGLRKPRDRIRGTDVAGTVESVGKNVTLLRAGDEVFGAGSRTLAEYAVAKAETVVPKPANLTFEQAAATPMAGLAALQALRDHGKVRAGQRVLINGAGGGIGTFAVQIAKAAGVEVTGVCSTEKVDLVRSLGADHVIDYTREDFTQRSERYDVILDNVVNHPLRRIRQVLARDGTLVPNGGQFDNRWVASLGVVLRAPLMSLFVPQRMRTFLSRPTRPDLLALADLMVAGTVVPVVDRTFPLSEAGAAFRLVGQGHARGKVVVTI